MRKIAIIGSGISGLSAAQCLKNTCDVTVYEKNDKPGGLIKCSNVDGNLYHIVGGHVFNSKRTEVLDFFWSFFNQEQEFTKAMRDARIIIAKENKKEYDIVGYPIEDHAYQLDEKIQRDFIRDLIYVCRNQPNHTPENFEEFLKLNFGETLYKLYFKPYNEKIWKRNLANVPLSWLEGKLPMPSIEEIIQNNFLRKQERNMVHSSFFYAKRNGSQFIADRLASGLNIKYNTVIRSITRKDKKWIVNETDSFDELVYTGNIKELKSILNGDINITAYVEDIDNLEYHGTTSVLCYIDQIPYSWVYMPDRNFSSHRIICTGNFSKNNNAGDRLSVTIEFTDFKSREEIDKELKLIPFNPQYITHTYTEFTYPIQKKDTKGMIRNLKNTLCSEGFHLVGRFAEWEYYNMDSAMGAAMDLAKLPSFHNQ